MLKLNEFLNFLQAFRKSSTVKQKEYNLKVIEEFFDKYGETYKFNHNQIAKLFRFLREEKGYKLSTIKGVFNDLKLYLSFLSKEGIETYFDNNALKFIFSSPTLKNEEIKEKEKRQEIFTKDELFNILEKIKERNEIYYYFTCLLAFSGLRINEALSLTIEDFERVEPLKWRIKVRNAKYNKERVAYLFIPKQFSDFENYLLEVKEHYNKTKRDILFKYRYSENGKIYNLTLHSVEKFYQRLSKELGIRINPHKFRKTFATLIALKIDNLILLKEILGHTDIKTTSKYYIFAKKLIEEKDGIFKNLSL
jgi:integrase/recombinase XerD